MDDVPADKPPFPAQVLDLGQRSYAEVWELQKSLVAQRQANASAAKLVLVEHHEVIPLGRGTHKENVLTPGNVPVFEIERGGDVTYHGPGQLVGYPIFLLRPAERDLHRYLRNLEEALILACGRMGVAADREPGWTGVWSQAEPRRKLASLGVACKRWVTYHGFALNVNTDLNRFGLINPCGLQANVMGSVSSCLRTPFALPAAKAPVVAAFAHVFGRRFANTL